jgi:hypothetical protein
VSSRDIPTACFLLVDMPKHASQHIADKSKATSATLNVRKHTLLF